MPRRRTFGRVYPRPERGGWVARYPDPCAPKDGPRRYLARSFPSRKSAVSFLAKVREAILAGTYAPPAEPAAAAPSLTVLGALDALIEAKVGEAASASTDS